MTEPQIQMFAGWLALGIGALGLIAVSTLVLTAVWEKRARQRLARLGYCDAGGPPNLKPRIRLRADGWVRHLGGPFPFDDRTVVLVRLASGVVLSSRGEPAARTPDQWWRGLAVNPDHDVLFYRIVGHPQTAPVAGRWSQRPNGSEGHHA